MFRFLHGYMPKLWEAQVQAGLVLENDGIRFCQSILIDEELKFNNLAKVGGDFYNLVAQRKCPLYIDRLQGGHYIEDYSYDTELIAEYKKLLGENFWGFQMHEWMSNYHHDTLDKLAQLPKEKWNEEEIKKVIKEKYPYPILFLESANAKEHAKMGKPQSAQEFYENITGIYKKRRELGEILPCDSWFLAYAFEVSVGTKRLMTEIGMGTEDTKIQVCYARGMTRAPGRSFGAYYEPWMSSPFSACCYNKDGKNEWNIGASADFPFEAKGENGGSSRSLQRRLFLYSFLSGAEFISEEWGLCNVFYDWENFELSPYGQVKKEFVDFVRKYTDVGDKITPMALVLPREMMVLDQFTKHNIYCGFETSQEWVINAKKAICDLFHNSRDMLGNEVTALKNSDIPDAIDIVNDGEQTLSNYDYLIDATSLPEFKQNHQNLCEIENVREKLCEILPVTVLGNAHWMVNHCTSGGYYLTIFNNSGIERTVEKGEIELEQATTTVKLKIKHNLTPTVCEGNGKMQFENGEYTVTIPAGGWSFIKLS